MRQTCVVEVGQQLFLLHEPLIQPVSQGLCLHRNLFYWVHPAGTGRDGQTGWEMKHRKRWLNSHSAEAVVRIDPTWKAYGPKPGVSAAVSEQKLESITAVCTFAEASARFGGFISWQTHQSETEVLRGVWQQTDESWSATKCFGRKCVGRKLKKYRTGNQGF